MTVRPHLQKHDSRIDVERSAELAKKFIVTHLNCSPAGGFERTAMMNGCVKLMPSRLIPATGDGDNVHHIRIIKVPIANNNSPIIA